MRIVHSHLWSWPEVRRGAERELRELAQRQAAHGHQVRVVSGTEHGLIRRTSDGPVNVTRLRVPRWGSLTAESGWSLPALPGLLLTPGDILHAWHYGDGAAATIARRGRPLVLKITGCVPRDGTHLRRVDRALLHRALVGASEVWVNDPWVVEAMTSWDVPMVVVPPGIDTTRFSPGSDRSGRPTVLAVGPPADVQKRIGFLLQHWPEVTSQVPEAQLRVAGDVSPAQRESMLAAVPQESRGSVQLLGAVANDELVEEYRSAWVLAATGGNEAFGLALVEALACGTPVVGTDTGATPSLLAGDDLGSIVPFDDHAALVQALVDRLQAAPSRADALRRSAAVSQHSWESRSVEVEQRYRKLLDG